MKSKWQWTFLVLSMLGTGIVYAEMDGIVEFHIPKGTGDSPWNTLETIVEVNVGDTLRIINDDDVAHRLHTFGKPCPHQDNNSESGEFYDCVVATRVDPRVDVFYDHNFGPTSRFYFRTK